MRYEWDGFYTDILNGLKPHGHVFTYVESLLPWQLPRALRQTQTFIHSRDALQQLQRFVERALRKEPLAPVRPPLPLEAIPRPKPSPAVAPVARPFVFISHVAEDAPVAEAVGKAVRDVGWDVWTADKSFDAASQEWEQSIERAIRDCAFFVPIISRHTESRTEGWFRREWYQASERALHFEAGHPFISPVVVGNVAPDLIPERFKEIQWTHMEGTTVPEQLLQFFRRHARDVS